MNARLTVHCACGNRFEHVHVDPNVGRSADDLRFFPAIVCPACKRECDPIDDVVEFEMIPGPPPSRP